MFSSLIAEEPATEDGAALALLRNRPVIVDRLPVGLPDIEATIMAAVPGSGRRRASGFSVGPARSDEGSHGEEDHTAY